MKNKDYIDKIKETEAVKKAEQRISDTKEKINENVQKTISSEPVQKVINSEAVKKAKKIIIETKMLIKYKLDFMIRLLIFISIFCIYVNDKSILKQLAYLNLGYGVEPIHILWLFLMIPMIKHIFPKKESSMTMNKAKKFSYKERKHNELELYKFVQDQNIKAWMVMLVWLMFNAIFGTVYLLGIIDTTDILMLSIFYYLSDYICILFFCPFQTFIMKNKCCVNCRIYDWGHFMMFTPMLFIKSFFSWSLFFTSVIVLIKWEIYYAKHPERFWEGSNENLRCIHCNEKLCQYKNKLKNKK